ncbi:amidohydrolase [Microbacterium sp. Marseille-Q6965]|uniref:amidohydrolase n=1 Tax=Microbacterium sp. Marseille-Q6965 TaxID=2965072 RepID=UPI0021B7CA8D|nr:amidohydrolase family protein [Microbacterium sp. Marseille-Q6965]
MDVGAVVDVIANARIAGEGRELMPLALVEPDAPYDVFLRNGRILDIAPAGYARHEGAVLDAEGAWLVPGLWDHHVHLRQWALSQARPSVAHAHSAEEAAAFAARHAPGDDGRRVLQHWREGLWAVPASLEALDATTGEVPTYLLGADSHSVWMNSAAFRREGLAADPSGVLREGPAFATIVAVNAVSDATANRAVATAASAAAGRGVVGVCDLEFGAELHAWRERASAGWQALRVHVAIYPDHLDEAIAAGLRTGDPLDEGGLVRLGVLKVLADGSLGTRTAWTSGAYADDPHHHGGHNVSPDEMTRLVVRAAAAGIATTIHAIGDLTNAAALDAFARAGVPGRIEHAQLVTAPDVRRFAHLGVAASVQPQHAMDDRELTEHHWGAHAAIPYPLRSFRDAGVQLLFGSDAPVAPLDPWIGMAAAVFRTDDDREPWRPDQAVDVRTALAASTAGGSTEPQTIEPGAPADLAIVGHDPIAADRDTLRAMPVHATILGGRLTHLA